MKPKLSTFNVAVHDSYGDKIPPRLIPVSGREVSYPQLPGVRLFVHRAVNFGGNEVNGCYIVSEYVTGARVTNDPTKTPEAAIEAFRVHLATYPACIDSFPVGIRNYLSHWPPANGEAS